MKYILVGFTMSVIVSGLAMLGLAYATSVIIFKEPPRRYQAGGYSFEIPDGWSCQTQGTETVCRPIDPEFARRAILVATAKVIGPNDNYAFYREYLSSPRTIKASDGETDLVSETHFVREVDLNGSTWLEAEQTTAYIPNFRTRSWVAKHGALSVLVTASIHKSLFGQNSDLIDKLGQSLEVRKLR